MKSNKSIVCIDQVQPAVSLRHRGTRWILARSAGWIVGLVVLLVSAWMATTISASELHPLSVALVESGGKDEYFEPLESRIVVRRQPISLFIRLRNISGGTLSIRASPELECSLELTDQAGTTSTIQRKKEEGEVAKEDIRVPLPPGADKIINLVLTRDKWDGIPEVQANKESTYKARVAYKTANGTVIHSEFYTLIFKLAE